MTEVSSEMLGRLRASLSRFRGSWIDKEIAAPQQAVLARFQPIFSLGHIPNITAEEFRSFLLFDNNRHWSGLHRQGTRMVSDMETLRTALGLLLDESRDLADRLDRAVEMVHGMGKNIATAILLVAFPDRYGVWNNQSEATLTRLKLWPQFERGVTFGRKYERVNQLLVNLANSLGIDLWTLDALWWFLDSETTEHEAPSTELTQLAVSEEAGFSEAGQRFGLERHLHVFLHDNWERLELGRDWEIYIEPEGDEVGYEYKTEVGSIDLLAKHRREPRWLVIELKREKSADQVVGQILRYMGWVRRHLAAEGDQVEGMIICREADKRLPYALEMVSNLELRTYEVQFRLTRPGAQQL